MSKKEFLSPFTLSYWRCSAKEFQNVRVLTFTAFMIAIAIVISSIFIPVGENLRIYFSFLANALAAMVCGPLMGLCAGFISDMIGFMLFPSGGFFPGYTLSTMLGFFIFTLFFYRARITILRIFSAKLLINLFINIGLGSLWSAILYGKGYYYYLIKSIVKNLFMLPIEVVLLVFIFSLLLPILSKTEMIPEQPSKKIPFY